MRSAVSALDLPVLYRVCHRSRETGDTVTLGLTPADGQAAVVFSPGQYNMLYVFGVGEVPISISGDPAEPQVLRHTVRAVGAVSSAICRLRKGMMIGVRGPFGTGWPMDAARGKDVVLIAGGIGLAPLRPAFYHLLRTRRDHASANLLCGARTPQDLCFRRDLERWQRQPGVRVEVTVDASDSNWQGHVGVVTRLIRRLQVSPADTMTLICGPEVMLRFVVWELLQLGVAPEAVFVSMERNMKCGVGICGHCQLGPHFVCTDGPVFSFPRVAQWFEQREV
jgi:NAD(P)H-flavin reductase